MNALTHILRAIKAALFALLCLAAVPAGFGAPDTFGSILLTAIEAIQTFPANAHERKQFREHQRMRATGQRVEVIWTFEQVDALLP